MTRDEAIKQLQAFSTCMIVDDAEPYVVEALNMAVEALEQEPCEDWYDVPSDEMTLEQARQTVKDLRKMWAEHLEQEPCEDAISRQWLMECVNEGWIKFDTEKDENRFIHLVRDIAPPVNPQPKTGHWIYGEDSGTGRDGWYCNQCGHFEFWDYNLNMKSAELNLPNPCPNCGAKMEE